jgi:hypothetical protein
MQRPHEISKRYITQPNFDKWKILATINVSSKSKSIYLLLAISLTNCLHKAADNGNIKAVTELIKNGKKFSKVCCLFSIALAHFK